MSRSQITSSFILFITISSVISCNKKSDPQPATNSTCVVFKTSNSQYQGEVIQYEYNAIGSPLKVNIYEKGILTYSIPYNYNTSSTIITKNYSESGGSSVFTYNSSGYLISNIYFSGQNGTGDTINDATIYYFFPNGTDVYKRESYYYITNNKMRSKKIVNFSGFLNGKPSIAYTTNYLIDTLTRQAQLSTRYLDKLKYSSDDLIMIDSSYNIINNDTLFASRNLYSFDKTTLNPLLLIPENKNIVDYFKDPTNSKYLLSEFTQYDKTNKIIGNTYYTISGKTSSGYPLNYGITYTFLLGNNPQSITILHDFEYQNCGN